MTYKLLALIIATLTGSIHCGSMCGGLSFSVGSDRKLQGLYQGSRLIAYLLVGAIAGFGGASLFDQDAIAWITAVSSLLLAFYLVFSGLHLWIAGRPIELSPRFLSPLFSGILRHANAFAPTKRAFLTGFFTPILPCAWLLTSVVLAVNSGSAGLGALILFAVWIGSLPALIAGPAVFRHISRNFHKNGRQVIAVLLVVAGLFSIFQRVNHGYLHDPRIEAESGAIPACLPAWGFPKQHASRFSMPAD